MARAYDPLLPGAIGTGVLSVALLLGGIAYRPEMRYDARVTATTEILLGTTLGGASIALSTAALFYRRRN